MGGLALFMAPDYQKIEKLRRGVQDDAIVADRFYLKPLMRLFQTLDEFVILGVSMNHVTLYRGDRDGIRSDGIKDLTFNFDDFWGEPNADRHIGSMSVSGNSTGGSKSRSVYHNYDDVHARKKVDLMRYFGAIDDAVCRVLVENKLMPVVLAALPEYQDLYRSRSRIRGLLEKGILANPDAMTVDELRTRAWALIRPLYEAMTDKVNEEYTNAQVVGKASDHLQEIARALAHGRVGKLLLEEDRKIPGRLMVDTGLVLFADLQNPHINDILDDFADVVHQSSGEVIVLPKVKMPTDRGVAAIYRY